MTNWVCFFATSAETILCGGHIIKPSKLRRPVCRTPASTVLHTMCLWVGGWVGDLGDKTPVCCTDTCSSHTSPLPSASRLRAKPPLRPAHPGTSHHTVGQIVQIPLEKGPLYPLPRSSVTQWRKKGEGQGAPSLPLSLPPTPTPQKHPMLGQPFQAWALHIPFPRLPLLPSSPPPFPSPLPTPSQTSPVTTRCRAMSAPRATTPPLLDAHPCSNTSTTLT